MLDAKAYLNKFGWSGGGLGRKEDGMRSFVRVSKKEDTTGVGSKHDWSSSWEDVFNNASKNVQLPDGILATKDESSDSSDSDSDTAPKPTAQAKLSRKRKTATAEDVGVSSDDSDSKSAQDSTAASLLVFGSFKKSAQALQPGSTTGLTKASRRSAAAVCSNVEELTKDSHGHMYGHRVAGKLKRLKQIDDQHRASASPSPTATDGNGTTASHTSSSLSTSRAADEWLKRAAEVNSHKFPLKDLSEKRRKKEKNVRDVIEAEHSVTLKASAPSTPYYAMVKGQMDFGAASAAASLGPLSRSFKAATSSGLQLNDPVVESAVQSSQDNGGKKRRSASRSAVDEESTIEEPSGAVAEEDEDEAARAERRKERKRQKKLAKAAAAAAAEEE